MELKFNQRGYIDMQFMPVMIGIVLYVVFLGNITVPDPDVQLSLTVLSVLLALATGAILFGFVMHLYCLGYPESPFNRHSSPLFMTLFCAGPFLFGAYRFNLAEMAAGTVIFTALGVLVIAASIAGALYRGKKPRLP